MLGKRLFEELWPFLGRIRHQNWKGQLNVLHFQKNSQSNSSQLEVLFLRDDERYSNL